MEKGRLEAFSDGVIAIIITIMVLEFKVPHNSDLESLKPLLPAFLSYALSFCYIGIYWNNHHHMFQAAKSVNGTVLWANLHLLFWLSMIPFVTKWMGENHFDKWPVICYGVLLIINAVAYTILARTLVRHHGKQSLLADALENDRKGTITVLLYAVAIALCFVNPFIGFGVYIINACIWIIPDRRIEKKMITKNKD